jgi:alkanesulfonate monooxygenase SsuD/methylene tetrahydromethanopterin reductase-like flavin-dependent oxidoreductase (luciferase family)
MVVRIGISITSFYRVDDVREGARRMIERARAADRAGLDSLFVGDHHVTPFPYYQNSVIMGRLLAEWGERSVGALYLLPLWHPVLLAEQVATLASIARGRFILQCAIGPRDSQFTALGVDPAQRPSRFEESLDILRRLWAGEEVTSDGRWQFESARISPTPPAPVEVWIGATAEPAIDRAARLGDGWLAAPALTPEAARRQLALYRERCDVHGTKPGVAAIRRDIYVGNDDAEARATGGPVVDAGYRGFPPGATVVGGPEAVAESFARLAEMGYSDVIVRNLVPDPDAAVASIERLAEVRALVGSL